MATFLVVLAPDRCSDACFHGITQSYKNVDMIVSLVQTNPTKQRANLLNKGWYGRFEPMNPIYRVSLIVCVRIWGVLLHEAMFY
jgi:hypothetical protein